MRNVFLLLLVSSLSVYAQNPISYTKGDLLIHKGIELHDSESYEEAIDEYKKVHPGDSAFAWAVYEIGFAYSALQEYDSVIKYCQKGLDLNEPYYNTSLYNILGTAYDEMGEQGKALEIYDRAIVEMPNSYNLYFNRALVYMNDSQYVKAFNDLKHALDINPMHASSHLQLAYLALNEGLYAQALMAAGVYFTLEPTGSRANSTLSFFNKAVASSEVELAMRKLNLSTEFGKQTSLNKLITNYVALNDRYEVDSKFELPIVKQMHLVIDKVKPVKKPEGWWNIFYAPFYEALKKQEVFEGFSYVVMASSGSDAHQRVIKSKDGDIKDYMNWAYEYLEQYRSYRTIDWDGKIQPVRYFYFDDGNLKGIGTYNATTKDPEGYTEFYKTNGSLSVQAHFDEKSERTGKWKWYYSDGQLDEEAEYKDNLYDGAFASYFDDGLPKLLTNYKAGKTNGITTFYHRDGYKQRDMHHVDGDIQDSLIYYYPNGKRRKYLPMKDSKVEGQLLYFDVLGNKRGEEAYVNNVENGPYTFYFENGQVETKGSYKNGKWDGDYEEYFINGQLKSKGKLVEGQKVGEWNTYYYNGNIDTKENYDLDGDLTGLYQDFTFDGFKRQELEYEDSKIMYFRQYDRKGAIVKEGKRKWGKFYFEDYTIDGVKVKEGLLVKGEQRGEWIYYTDNGLLSSKENYNDEGKLEGVDYAYHASGEVRSAYTYADGVLQGYFVNYHPNGQISSHGWYENGYLEGAYEVYTPGGVLVRRNYYNAGVWNGSYTNWANDGSWLSTLHHDYETLRKVESPSTDGENKVVEVIKGTGKEQVYYPNGQLAYSIEYLNGNYYGPVRYFYANGQKSFESSYVNNNLYGKTTWYFPNGNVKTEGNYKLHGRDGEWRKYYEDGTLEETYSYENGELDGLNKEYYKSGIIEQETDYYQGVINGKRIFYSSKGNVDHIRYYLNGRIIGHAHLNKNGEVTDTVLLMNETGDVTSYHPNGNVSRTYSINKGAFKGEYKVFYEDGTLKYKSNYRNNLRHGEAITYYPNGKPKTKQIWEDDQLNGEVVHYYQNGTIKKTVPYVYGDIIGTYIEYNEAGKPLKEVTWKDGDFYSEKTI
jgi:antitoxin component YwqK of YwqJK toxin-antitoxin module